MNPPAAPFTRSVYTDTFATTVAVEELIAATLSTDGFEVTETRDGLELLAALEELLGSGARETSVVVTDVNMPGLSGLDVLAAVRCAAVRLPVILITAFVDADTVAEARELDGAILAKPFDLDALRAAVAGAVA